MTGTARRILVTGGAGCLGSNLIEHYISAGHQLLAIDNFATGKPGALPPAPGLTVVAGSIAGKALVDRCFDGFRPTHVVHAAASYKDPANWAEDAATNVTGTLNVLAAARRHAVRRLVYLQTALCYGRPRRTPIPVDHPLQPFTSYGVSKTAGELYALMAEDIPVVSLRLANVTGPRLATGPIPTFYKRLKAGQGCFCSDTRRDFLDMEDFISVMEIVMEADAPAGVFNISTGTGHGIKDVFDAVSGYLGIRPAQPVPVVPPGPDDIATMVLDPSRTREILGWQPQYDFAATIRRMLEWYDAWGVTDVHGHLAVPAGAMAADHRR